MTRKISNYREEERQRVDKTSKIVKEILSKEFFPKEQKIFEKYKIKIIVYEDGCRGTVLSDEGHKILVQLHYKVNKKILKRLSIIDSLSYPAIQSDNQHYNNIFSPEFPKHIKIKQIPYNVRPGWQEKKCQYKRCGRMFWTNKSNKIYCCSEHQYKAQKRRFIQKRRNNKKIGNGKPCPNTLIY